MNTTREIRLLVIEDSEVSRILIESLFDEYPTISVVSVENGTDAFDFLSNDKPDIILLDLMLPGLNGFEILEKLKSNSQTKDIPVIMVSAKGQEQDIHYAMELGASDYVVKPIGVNRLFERVMRQVESRT